MYFCRQKSDHFISLLRLRNTNLSVLGPFGFPKMTPFGTLLGPFGCPFGPLNAKSPRNAMPQRHHEYPKYPKLAYLLSALRGPFGTPLRKGVQKRPPFGAKVDVPNMGYPILPPRISGGAKIGPLSYPLIYNSRARVVGFAPFNLQKSPLHFDRF